MVAQQGFLPIRELCRQLEVSEATARRDLSALENEKKIRRTYGGALSEFESRFPSFTERRGRFRRAKAKIAATALSFIIPNRTYYFDTGTTMFAIAEEFRAHPITPLKIVTPNIPLGELLAGIEGVQVFFPAGQLFSRQSVLLGEPVCRSLEFWRFDVAFLSAEAMNSTGIWNSQADVIKQQKVVLRRSASSVFCLDASKLNHKALHFLIPWNKIGTLLTDAPRSKLQQAGIRVRASRYCPAA
ncbi:MAG: DeoR/GlpR family DNA-binding transcription regulator [Methylacidiphilales bacterium]|nr:DeoR/GlpR family DNA-binding transcription regulator [Candidatus Methylacidiphilales bacterium]